MKLNLSGQAGSTKGYKHTLEFGLKRKGILNPMADREKSAEFIAMQYKNKKGINNPLYGLHKSKETLDKIIKLVYVYDSISTSFIGAPQLNVLNILIWEKIP